MAAGSITGGGVGSSYTGSATGGAAMAGAAATASGVMSGSVSGSTDGAAGLTTLTSRGGPRTGAAGFGGSAFFATGAFLAPPFAGAGCSANMSPPGSEMPRCRAMRSTNERATTSSTVLDALFSSMPCSRLSSDSTSWLVVPSSSATL